jgi:hypothetical protein
MFFCTLKYLTLKVKDFPITIFLIEAYRKYYYGLLLTPVISQVFSNFAKNLFALYSFIEKYHYLFDIEK